MAIEKLESLTGGSGVHVFLVLWKAASAAQAYADAEADAHAEIKEAEDKAAQEQQMSGNHLIPRRGRPDEVAKLREHPELMASAVEEILRYEPPSMRCRPAWSARSSRACSTR